MSKLDSKPKHQANIPLSSHDLSHTLDYTSAIGMLLPVCHDLLNPGEKVSLSVDLSQTRTMPLQSAAFCDIDLHTDYFFVPMPLLYSPFESFIYRINDNFTSFIANGTDVILPLLNLDNMAAYIDSNKSTYPTGNTPYSGLFDCIGKGTYRLLDMLGYNPAFGTMVDSVSGQINVVTPDYHPSVFPYPLLAYQAIYQYYYRLDDFEQFNQAMFNVDSYASSAVIPIHERYVNLHYRPYYMDYFNSIKNSPIVTATNLSGQPAALPLAQSWLSRSNSGSMFSYGTGSVLTVGSAGSATTRPTPIYATSVKTQFGFNSEIKSPSPVNTFMNGVDINTANIRAMFANEKLWSITGAAKKTYDAQTLAHFGFDVPVDVKHEIQHFGHDVTTIHIGEVISTAGTATQPLGTIAGKGYAENNRGKTFKFTAPCHGVLMVLTSAMVKQNYIAGMDKANAVAQWQDFYQPEFDHLGMQPLFGYEVTNASNDAATIYGWQYRYEQFKRKYNRASRAFSAGYFSSWMNVQRPYRDIKSAAANVPTDFLAFYSSPWALNGIMVNSYSTAWTDDYLTNPEAIYEDDPLVHHAYINYKKLSTMSTYSMPRLDA